MNATILPNNENHYPVLLNEIISIISPQYGGTYIDCTFGLGGHTKAILRNLESNAALTSIDRDSESSSYARTLSTVSYTHLTLPTIYSV